MDDNLTNIPEETEMYVCFRWLFFTKVATKKGKKYKNHQVIALGKNYEDAKADLNIALNKKRHALKNINSVKIKGIAFAFYCMDGNPRVPNELRKNIQWPEVPVNL